MFLFRSILAGVIGYLAMALTIMTVFTTAFLTLGPDRVFEPGSFDTAPVWIAVWGITSVVAAILGGYLCAQVARPGSKAFIGLAAVVLVLGIVTVFTSRARPDPGPRDPELPVFEAASKAVQPPWTVWSQPVIGVVGVIAGGRLARKRTPGTLVEAS